MIKLEDKLYTSTEVASILGVSLRSVYRYIEEGKLTAEVKTATGRHRFTKQDILDFLYPDGEAVEPVREEKKKPNVSEYSYTPTSKPERAERPERVETPFASVNNFSSKSVPTPAEDAEDVDWLSKFRAAAEKFRQEESTSVSNEKESTSRMDIKQTSDLRNTDTHVAPKEESNTYYYRSSLGGLKDIAQTLDKSAKEASLEYAFTLNAGLSLHKPIKPFSLLHAYVKPNDLNYFEKLLSLTPSDSSNAQLCLMTADNDSMFRNKESLHGLSVVSKSQLRKDVEAMAQDLRDDLYSIL